jgi:uncharacterized protein
LAISKKIASAAALSGAAAFVYATLVEPYLIQTVYLDLYCPRLPCEFDGYRILQLSDFHTRKLGRRETLCRDLAKKLPEHDLLLITGDLIHTPGGAPAFLEIAKGFTAKDGVYAVFGNSEHKNGVRSKELAANLEAISIHTLINRHIVIERGESSFYLVGVDDPASCHDDLALAMRGVPEGSFKLLMMHSPDPIGHAVALGIDVVLSGHTHGGQVKLPIVGPLHTNSLLGPSMSHGLYSGASLFHIIGFRAGRTQLYVTRGVGVSGLALRFLCRPEITSITLHANVSSQPRTDT